MSTTYFYSSSSYLPAAHKNQLERVSSETDSGSNCDKVKMKHQSDVWLAPSLAFDLGKLIHISFLPLRQNGQVHNGEGNSRHASLSEEEENLAVLRR